VSKLKALAKDPIIVFGIAYLAADYALYRWAEHRETHDH
jgi:hypothetical protein